MVRTNEGGSVLGFIAVAVVLIALFLGGVFLMQRQTARPPEPTPPQLAPIEQPPAPELPGPAPSEPTPAPSTAPPAGTPQTRLPETGPHGTIGSAAAAGIIVAVVVAYMRSRRLQPSL